MSDEMCAAQHPFYHIVCLRNPKHDGMHWFQTRWKEGACVLCREESNDLNSRGVCPDCIERLVAEAAS